MNSTVENLLKSYKAGTKPQAAKPAMDGADDAQKKAAEEAAAAEAKKKAEEEAKAKGANKSSVGGGKSAVAKDGCGCGCGGMGDCDGKGECKGATGDDEGGVASALAYTQLVKNDVEERKAVAEEAAKQAAEEAAKQAEAAAKAAEIAEKAKNAQAAATASAVNKDVITEEDVATAKKTYEDAKSARSQAYENLRAKSEPFKDAWQKARRQFSDLVDERDESKVDYAKIDEKYAAYKEAHEKYLASKKDVDAVEGENFREASKAEIVAKTALMEIIAKFYNSADPAYIEAWNAFTKAFTSGGDALHKNYLDTGLADKQSKYVEYVSECKAAGKDIGEIESVEFDEWCKANAEKAVAEFVEKIKANGDNAGTWILVTEKNAENKCCCGESDGFGACEKGEVEGVYEDFATLFDRAKANGGRGFTSIRVYPNRDGSVNISVPYTDGYSHFTAIRLTEKGAEVANAWKKYNDNFSDDRPEQDICTLTKKRYVNPVLALV